LAPSFVTLVYPDLKSLAHYQLASERPDHTLNTTAIVHEAFVRLAGGKQAARYLRDRKVSPRPSIGVIATSKYTKGNTMLTKYLIAAIAAIAVLPTTPAIARHDKEPVCVQTAKTMLEACRYDVNDNYYETIANCQNLGDRRDRKACYRDAYVSKREEREFCGEVKEARLEACELLNEDRYDPDPLLSMNLSIRISFRVCMRKTLIFQSQPGIPMYCAPARKRKKPSLCM